MQANSFIITLEDTTMLSPHVKHFIFKHQHAVPFHFEPGQFITLHIKHQDNILKRSYSLANSPKLDNCLEFAAGFVPQGVGSDFLFKLKPGDTVQATGPFGRLTLKSPDPLRYILVATSTGITPYRSMLPTLTQRLEENPVLHVVILQGVKKRIDLLYHEEFKTFAKTSDRIQYYACLSQETSPLEKDEHQGYVQTLLSKLSLSKEEDMAYLCGNPSMVDDAFQLLKEEGFAVTQIIREKYISR